MALFSRSQDRIARPPGIDAAAGGFEGRVVGMGMGTVTEKDSDANVVNELAVEVAAEADVLCWAIDVGEGDVNVKLAFLGRDTTNFLGW